MSKKIEVEMYSGKLVFNFGFPESLGFIGLFGTLGGLYHLLGIEQIQYLWILCAMIACFSFAFFKKSSINLRMPARLGVLGFLGFLGFLGYIPGLEFLKGLFSLHFFFGFLGAFGHQKKLFYSDSDMAIDRDKNVTEPQLADYNSTT